MVFLMIEMLCCLIVSAGLLIGHGGGGLCLDGSEQEAAHRERILGTAARVANCMKGGGEGVTIPAFSAVLRRVEIPSRSHVED